MTDLKSAKLIWLKAILFLLLGSGAAALLLADSLHWQTVILLAIVIWSFCRAYYFAFYVIEHYLDPGFRFSGLLDFLRYVLRKR